MTDHDKYERLTHYLKRFKTEGHECRVLIFVETKRGCDQLQKSLKYEEFDCRYWKGEKERER
jgi:ATP-dependent RNA helicase DDX5/DBP2